MDAVRAVPCTNPFRIETQSQPVIVRRHDAVLASTRRALLVYEEGRVPVYYVPKDDVYIEHLVAVEPTGVMGREPPEGIGYYSVTASGGGVEQAAWMFKNPKGSLAPLAGHIGFDPDQFGINVG